MIVCQLESLLLHFSCIGVKFKVHIRALCMSMLMSLTRAGGAAQRVLSLVDRMCYEILIAMQAQRFRTWKEKLLSFENSYFCYQMRPQHPVLSGVDLTVGKGDVCALVGRSGGGKSTIVHLLMRYYDPSQGRILLDDWDVRDLNLKSVHNWLHRKRKCFIACSTEENITHGLSSTGWQREEMEETARYANAHDFPMKFPEGYATRVGERVCVFNGRNRSLYREAGQAAAAQSQQPHHGES